MGDQVAEVDVQPNTKKKPNTLVNSHSLSKVVLLQSHFFHNQIPRVFDNDCSFGV